MLTCIGEWPTQSNRTRRGCRIVLTYFYVSEIMSRMRTIYNHRDASNIVMDAMLPIFQQVIGAMFFISFILNSEKVSYLFLQF